MSKSCPHPELSRPLLLSISHIQVAAALRPVAKPKRREPHSPADEGQEERDFRWDTHGGWKLHLGPRVPQPSANYAPVGEAHMDIPVAERTIELLYARASSPKWMEQTSKTTEVANQTKTNFI